MKRFLILLLTVFVVCFGVACGKDGTGKTSNVCLSESNITVELYNQYTLKATALNKTAAEFEWSSSDERVANVENGVVTANALGTATIRAKTGKDYGECVVTVVRNGSVPVLSVRSSLELAVDSEYELSPVLRFKGEEVEGTYVWVSADPSVASVENGVVKARKAGNTTITVSTEAYGELLTEEITVVVKSGAAIVLNEEYVRLYKPNEAEENTRFAVAYRAMGGELQAPVEWTSENESVAIVDATGKIQSVGKGETLIRATSTINGERVNAGIRVYVTVPVVDRTDVLFDFDSKTGDVSGLSAAIGMKLGEKIEKISERTKQGYVAFEYFEGSQTLVKSGAWSVGEKEWQIETSDTAYDIRTLVVSRVLRTKEDVLGMKRYNATVMTEPEYYVLANDIDMEYADCPSLFVNGDSAGSMAWWGTFDGRGHAIRRASFLTAWVATAGFFGSIGENSVVKNVAFTSVGVDGAYSVFASFIFGRVQNVFIDFNPVVIGGTARVTGLFALEAKGTSLIENVVVNYGEFSLWNGRNQCAFINTVATGATIRNVYTVYRHASDPTLEKMFMTVAAQAQIDQDTVKLLRNESEFKREYFEGWDESVWALPTEDGVVPTFR